MTFRFISNYDDYRDAMAAARQPDGIESVEFAPHIDSQTVGEWQVLLDVERASKAGQQKDEPAWKQDGGKPRMDLLAPEFLSGTAAVLTFGAAKYEARNWEKGMSWGRVFGALMRHLWAWWGGESRDAETGLSHLHHAACCLMFLAAYEAREIGTDDRKIPVD